MNLLGSITELQETAIQLYLELEHRFKENQLIRDLWSAMAHDITRQKRSMHVLTPSFWNRLKAKQDGVSEGILENGRKQLTEKKEDHSLSGCFERALLFEELITVGVYVPIIRKLRENWTDQALDVYIMVKAHLARITRATQLFAGDPIVIQRANLLLQHFEKEVQEPHTSAVPEVRRARAAGPSRTKRGAKPQKQAASKKAAALTKHVKTHRNRTKSLVKKINLQQRRRARR